MTESGVELPYVLGIGAEVVMKRLLSC